ncbi:MAG TPA: IPT/TIG domain-containing protein [Sandaracinaceae bacterium LLY-WYZ-13_1]|nr:IPT/TIG domain-containing protein [Sandaracinaceae bacterium LLY-WYZ-13_1]
MSSRKRTLRTARVVGVLLSLAVFAGGAVACGGSEGGELEITNIDPRAGATAGEQTVKITGNNFRRDISYTVYFGNKRAERATILDDHTLVVSTPGSDDPRAVDVIVAADNGPAYRIVEGYRYEDMGGNVMENVGSATSGQGEERF